MGLDVLIIAFIVIGLICLGGGVVYNKRHCWAHFYADQKGITVS